MLMEFKEGDRVRVLRLNNSNVDFFTTLRYVNLPGLYQMIDSTDSNYNEHLLCKSNQRNFGPDKDDYYVPAEDEEDTEEPVIQKVEYINKAICNAEKYIEKVKQDNVNHPDHYNYGEIEIIEFIEQVTQHYNSDVAYHIGNAIKYLARSPHKNGKEDIEKARWYIERAYQKWSD